MNKLIPNTIKTVAGFILGGFVSLIILEARLMGIFSAFIPFFGMLWDFALIVMLVIPIVIVWKSYKSGKHFFMGVGLGLFAYIILEVVHIIRTGWISF